MNKYTGVISFIFGAGVGAAAAYYLLKNKYEAIAQEEIESVKEAYLSKEAKKTEHSEVVEKEPTEEPDEFAKRRLARNKPDISVYTKQVGKLNYSECFDEEAAEKEAEPELAGDPYVVPPEEFGEYEDYERRTLYFFKDEILADEDYEIIEDIDDIVGSESLNHFGEYEDDSVYVRNDRHHCDYEILLDEREYNEVKIVQMRNGRNPYSDGGVDD